MMKFDISNLRIEKAFAIRWVTLLAMVFFAAGFARIGWDVCATAKAVGGIDSVVKEIEAKENSSKEHFEEYAKEVAKVYENGMFFVPKPKPPKPRVLGILGKKALVDNQWKAEGDSAGAAKILKVCARYVLIEWEGKEEKIYPFAHMEISKRKPASKEKKQARKAKKKAKQGEAQEEVKAEAGGEDPLAWLGIAVTDQQRSYLLRMFNAVKPEELEQIKKAWSEMSQEQKQQEIDKLQQAIDSGDADKMIEQMENR